MYETIIESYFIDSGAIIAGYIIAGYTIYLLTKLIKKGY